MKVIGEIECRGVKLEFKGDRDDTLCETLYSLIKDGYREISLGRSFGEYKVPLYVKANVEIDGVKVTKGADFIDRLVAEGWLPENALLPTLVKQAVSFSDVGVENCGSIETQEAVPYTGDTNYMALLSIKSIEGVLKDGSIIKSFKNGMIRVGSDKYESDYALEMIRYNADHDNIEEINGVLELSIRDGAGMETEERPLFKFNNIGELSMLFYMLNGRGKASVREYVDANSLISRLLNVRHQDLCGIIINEATISVNLGTQIAIFTARDNVFSGQEITEWDEQIDLSKISTFQDWYDTIKVLHGAGANIVVVGSIKCTDIDKEVEVEFDNVASLRAESNKRRNRIIEQTEGELLEIADNLEDMATRIREVVNVTDETESE